MALPSNPRRPATLAPVPEETASATGGGGYAVQVSSTRSAAQAQAVLRSLQSRFPQQLGARHTFVRSVDLGSKGIYYRSLVGPFASGAEATQLCSQLKAAGGNCFVQRF
jgi:cell division septation protein DedD